MRGFWMFAIAACGAGSKPAVTHAPATTIAPSLTRVAPRSLEPPAAAEEGTLAPESWVFVVVDPEGRVRLGSIPDGARSQAGVAIAQLATAGDAVATGTLADAARDLIRQHRMAEPPPPPPPPPVDRSGRKTENQRAREQAIAAARAAGILGGPRPACGEPMPMLQGTGGERPPEVAPDHAIACPVDPAEHATYAILVAADRRLPAEAVFRHFLGDSPLGPSRLAVTTDGAVHVRALPIQFGQFSQPGPARLRPAADRVIVLGPRSDPTALANGVQGPGEIWIWVQRGTPYGPAVELIARLAARRVPITVSLDDPRAP